MCGVRTNIVTAVEIKDRDASDTKLLPPLVDTTAKNFTLNEVAADKGYGSLNNYEVIASTARCRISRSSQFIPDAAAVCGPRCTTISSTTVTNT